MKEHSTLPETKEHLPRKAWRLDRKLADNSFLLSVSILCNILQFGLICILPLLAAEAASRTVQVAVIDPHGNIYSTSTERLMSSTALVKLTAESFILAGYSKDPLGFRFTDMMHNVATQEVADGFQKYWQLHESDDFAARHIHQSPEIGKIKIISRSEEGVIAAAEGQLIRAGVVDGNSFSESVPFKIILTMKVSMAHTKSLSYPLQVVGTQVEVGGRKT